MNNLCKSALIVSVCLIAAGCEKAGLPLVRKSAIRLNVSAAQMTKGLTLTTDSLDSFKMMAMTGEYIDHRISETETQKPTDGIYFNSYVKQDGSNWYIYDSATATSPSTYYWINDNPIAFWSWRPYDSEVNGTLTVTTPAAPPATGSDSLKFTYALPTHVDGADASNQQDLIFAGNVESRTFDDGTDDIKAHTSTNTNYTRNDNELDIVFYHPLSKIQFGVDVTDNTFNKNIIIKKIELQNLRGSGTCTFKAPSTFSWDQPASSTNTYSQIDSVDFSACTGTSTDAPKGWPYNSANGLYIGSNSFFLIPQTLPADASITITLELDGSTITKTASLPSVTWKPGCYYTYKIKAQGERANLTFGIGLADWSEREGYIPIY